MDFDALWSQVEGQLKYWFIMMTKNSRVEDIVRPNLILLDTVFREATSRVVRKILTPQECRVLLNQRPMQIDDPLALPLTISSPQSFGSPDLDLAWASAIAKAWLELPQTDEVQIMWRAIQPHQIRIYPGVELDSVGYLVSDLV